MRIFELTEPKENCTHIKVLSDADVPTKVIGDLGIMKEDDGGETFVTKYSSAVVLKSEIIDYLSVAP